MVMDNWRDRLLVERDELAERLRKLEGFIDEGDLSKLAVEQAALLIAQGYAMRQYLDILDARLDP